MARITVQVVCAEYFLRRLRMLDELERGVSVTLGDEFTVNNNLANVDKHAPVRSGNCGLCN